MDRCDSWHLLRWYILYVYCPLPNRSPSKGWFSKGSFFCTSTPSPPPVSFLLASATLYSCATWYCWQDKSYIISNMAWTHLTAWHLIISNIIHFYKCLSCIKRVQILYWYVTSFMQWQIVYSLGFDGQL